MIQSNKEPDAQNLLHKIEKMWELSAKKIRSIEKKYDIKNGAPVYTVNGKYTSRGWTEWTQGFQYGSALLQFDATDEQGFLELGRKNTIEKMATHISHIGVHDHGFNNISTYGNLLRMMHEGKTDQHIWQQNFYELALKISGAVQASRWTVLPGGGYIHSFNGAHSLFVDTIRSCRSLFVGHLLGHQLQAENDVKINLLDRALQHMIATAKYSIYYGEGRDAYDISGRTAHEAIFNVRDGNFRCPNSQQGYSGFTTWTRGLAWAICGFAEELELIIQLDDPLFDKFGGKPSLVNLFSKACQATCDFFIKYTPIDGIPYWDTGAPGLVYLGDYLETKSNPFNQYEPVDSSAAAIACQGLIRYGNYLNTVDNTGDRYINYGMTILDTLLDEPYLSLDDAHQGLLLHSIYHRPNGWDHVPHGSQIPNGESCMWGDYHLRESALVVQRMLRKQPYYSYFNGLLK